MAAKAGPQAFGHAAGLVSTLYRPQGETANGRSYQLGLAPYFDHQ